MHNFLKIYYFIDKFNRQEIIKLDPNIALIYRNYSKNFDLELIRKIKGLCKKQSREFYISNNLKIALKLNLDGLYLPAFRKNLNYKNITLRKNFKIIGSAHNIPELKIKENQGCETIFISPMFKTNKNNYFLDVNKFNFIAKNSRKKIAALGGINSSNIKRINLTKGVAIASITWIKKNRPK